MHRVLRWQHAAAFALLLVLSSTAPTWAQQRPQPRVAPEFLLERGRAGPIEIGQPIDEIYIRFDRERIRLVADFPEGQFQPALEIRLFQRDYAPALIVQIREWPCPPFRAWSIMVIDRRFRTVDGLRVGSTFADIRKRYPAAKASWGEGERVVVISEAGLTFMLDSAEVRDETSVSSIYVFPADPEAIRAKRCPDREPTPR